MRASPCPVILTVAILAGLSASGCGQAGQKSEDAWRTDLNECAKRVVAMATAKTAIVPTEDALLNKIRPGRIVKLMDKDGVVIWVLDHSVQMGAWHEEEIQAIINKAFFGRVAWQGVIKSIKEDKKNRSITVEVAIPPAGHAEARHHR